MNFDHVSGLPGAITVFPNDLPMCAIYMSTPLCSLEIGYFDTTQVFLVNSLALVKYNCGQSYKASTIINYNSRVIPDLKIHYIITLEL